MYCTTHFIAGAIIGVATPSPVLAAAAGLVSHAVLDYVPHSDYSRAVQGALDVACSLLVALGLLAAGADVRATAGGLGAVLPDLEVAAAFVFPGAYTPHGRLRLVFPSHSGVIRHGRLAPPWGVLTQVLAILGLTAFFLRAL
ncbi:MAG: hypothetical protein NUW12_03330 [Firmicutes bacterium]|nr:hypothetical protein [Bacillota bacterium]MDH7495005.1 hypothetical protein [Bacillota bacterium]